MLLDHRQVIVDQLSLGLAFRSVAEGIEHRAAQEFEPGQQPKSVDHPAAIFFLLQMTRRLVAPSKDGRSKVVSYADVAFEFIAELFGKAAVGIEPRYLAFVLVGHQLEEVFGYRLREFGGTRRGLSLGAANLRNGCEIAVGVGFILIFGEEFGSISKRFA